MRTCVRMAHPKYLRDKALQLRTEKRLTIDELARAARCPADHDLLLGFRTSRSKASPAVLRARTAKPGYAGQAPPVARGRICEGRADVRHAVGRPDFRDFVTLYVAEGYSATATAWRSATPIRPSSPCSVVASEALNAPADLRDPVPRRPGSRGATRVLGLTGSASTATRSASSASRTATSCRKRTVALPYYVRADRHG